MKSLSVIIFAGYKPCPYSISVHLTVDDNNIDGILSLASGHCIRPDEVIQCGRTKAQASVIANGINALNLGSAYNILRQNSRLQRYFAKVNAEFVEKAERI